MFAAFPACALADPLPDPATLARVIGEPGNIAFLAAYGKLLEGLDAATVPGFREALAAGIEQGILPKQRGNEALKRADATWARLDPRGLLEAAALRKRPYSPDAQAAALATLIGQDRELAIRLYLTTPMRESFSHHVEFYRKLSAVDPARAVGLYLETSDSERTFDNPLTTAFEAWARRDADAAWPAASGIEDEKKRRAAQGVIIRELAKKDPRKVDAFLNTIPDERTRQLMREDHATEPNAQQRAEAAARRAMAEAEAKAAKPEQSAGSRPPPKENGIDDATLERMLAAGVDAYDSGKQDLDGRMIESLFSRYPDRAWTWLRQMDLGHTYAFNRYRDLALKWPRERLADDSRKLLGSVNLKDQRFGVQLAVQWMAADPETAVPWLFSRQPKHCGELRRSLPFHTLVYQKKWSRAQVMALMDRIEDPACREMARSEVVLDELRTKPPAEALPLLLSLKNEEDRMRGLRSLVRSGVRSEKPADFIRQVRAIGDEQVEIRDRMLEALPAEILDTNDGDAGAIPGILAAIRNPETRLRAIEGMQESIPRVLNERLIGVYLELPAGSARDRRIASWIGDLPPRDLLAFARKSGNPGLQRLALTRIPTTGRTEEEFADCLELLDRLPPVWRDEPLAARWLLAKAERAAVETWPRILKELSEKPELSGNLHGIMSAWIERDPEATLRALRSTGPRPELYGWYFNALHAANLKDLSKTFGALRARPVLMDRMAGHLIQSWAASDPRAAGSASLLLEPEELRLPVFESTVATWLREDPKAATAWIRGLPRSPERAKALEQLAAACYRTRQEFPDALKSELPPDSPYLRKPPPRAKPPRIPDRTPAKPDAERRKALADAKAREARQRTIAAIRSLALLDEPAVVANVRSLPAGPDKIDSMLGLLEHAAAAGNDQLAADMAKQLRAARPGAAMLVTIAGTIARNTPLASLDKLLASERAESRAEVREALAPIILARWTAAEYRPRIERWIRGQADAARRQALAGRYLTEWFSVIAKDPAAEGPDIAPVLRGIVVGAARSELASAMLDDRLPKTGAAGAADLDENTRRQIEPWIEQRTAREKP